MSEMTIDPNAHAPVGNAQTDAAAQTSGDGKVKDKAAAAADALVALAQKAVTVSTMTRAQGQATTGASGRTGVPVLDNPEDPKAILQDLEKLIAFLQLDNDEHQGELARARIDSQQAAMDRQHADRLNKIAESIKAAEKAEQAALASRVLGWIGAFVAVLTAVVVTVCTGGVAAGFAIAGAVLAVGQVVMSETGAEKKIVNSLADKLQDEYGWSKAKARSVASGIYTTVFIVAGFATSCVGGIGSAAIKASKAAVDTMSMAARVATLTTQILNLCVGLSGAGVGFAQAAYSKDAADASADVKEVARFIAIIQQMLDESKDELQQLMDQIQSVYAKLVALIQSKTDTGNLILQKLNQMV